MTVPVPDFLVIGAYKSGTTSLHHQLRSHPDVFVPERKEPNFFAVDGNPSASDRLRAESVTTLAAYQALFAPRAGEAVAGEVSPEYLANPWAPARIHRRCPDAKLVVVLRHPVDRAWSDYLMYVRDGVERHGFADALALQDVRRAADDPTGAYLSTGRYGEQLQRYYDLFRAEQIAVHLFEDYVRDPQTVTGEVFRFLGVDPVPVAADTSYNASGVPRNATLRVAFAARKRVGPALKRVLPESARPHLERLAQRGLVKPALDPRLRAELTERFADDVALVERLTGRDLTAWRTT